MITVEILPEIRKEEHPPLLAHYGDGNQVGLPTALCGQRIMGVPAPDTAPVCAACAEAYKELNGWLR